jgi:PTS system mannose-specific IIA component
MIGIVLFGHGNLSEELKRSVEMILGQQEVLYSLGVGPEEGEESIVTRLASTIEKADRGEGVLLLTDMFGGTPMNMSCRYLEDTRVEVVTGINLAGLIKALTARKEPVPLAELAKQVAIHGKGDISVAGELLRPDKATRKTDGT